MQSGIEKLLLGSHASGTLNLRGRAMHAIPAEVFSEDPGGERTGDARRPRTLQNASFGGGGHSDAPSWWEVRDLVTLVVSHNVITELPEEVARLTALEKLDIGHNQLQTLPGEALASLPLRALDVSNNQLQALPAALPCHTLAQLFCGGNTQLRVLPVSIGDCHRLAELSAPGCQLVGVPVSLAHCHSLVSLDLSGNQLGASTDLPDSLPAGLVSLRDLNVARNRLVSLPNTLGAMRALVRLHANPKPPTLSSKP
jgi:Leucine-rich repeat (LRR) protein